MRKHIIITSLFEFGGSNAHLAALIKYFGADNVLLLLENKTQLVYLKNIAGAEKLKVRVIPGLHHYAHLKYKFTTNIKELFYITKSILVIQRISIVNGFASVTINAVEPEKYLFLLLLPAARVFYILHTTPDRRYSPFTSAICNLMLGRLKKIVTVSKANKNEICQNWEIAQKKVQFIEVIYNCTLKPSACLLNNKNDEGIQTVITLGHVVPYKNPGLWLEVARLVIAKYGQVRFSWLGNGPCFEEFKTATLGDPGINFFGLVQNPQRYLQNASIYYQPSSAETHGIAVVEAMSCSLPCVVSSVGGLPESVEHDRSGFVINPLDATQHAASLCRLLENEGLRQEFGAAGYSRYNRLFTFEAFKRRMNDVYRKNSQTVQ